MALASLNEHGKQCRLTKEENDAISCLWKQIGYRDRNEWHRLYKAVNSFDARYVPNDVYGLELLPRLNSTKLLAAWDDKAYYQRFFPYIRQPSTVAFVIDGAFYDKKYSAVDVSSVSMMLIDSYDRVIIKPSYGLEGRGVELVETKEHDCSSLKEKLLSYGRNYVVQEVIRQHKSLAVYNNSSVNPIRIMTLRMNGVIHYLHSTLRFGIPGSNTDISFIGKKEIARVCAVSNQGDVSKVWFDTDGKKHSISDLRVYEQERIPGFGKIIDIATSVHEGLQHFDLVGCDFTIDQHEEPILIEYNVFWPGIIFPQYCHGPLFGELTDELISYLENKPKK